MPYQTGQQIAVTYKEEATFGTLHATPAGGTAFRANSGNVSLSKASIESGENRSDGMMTRGRHGSKSVSGQYVADLSLGTFDALIEAAFRGTFTALQTITEATAALSSATISVSGSTVTFSAGSVITAGVRVGQVHRWSSGVDAADRNKNLRVTTVTATTIVYAESLTTVGGPVATYSFTIPKVLLQGITDRSFDFEEHEIDIDGSEIFTGCRVGSLQLQLGPDGMGILTFGIVGQDMQTMTAGSAPYFTSPTTTTSLGMTAAEAVIRLGSADLVDVSGLTINIDLRAAGTAVVGATVTPDVFVNNAQVTGSITALRQDLAKVANFLNEDQLALHILFTENETEPKDFASFFLGNLTLSSATKSELGQEGPRTQELALQIGKDERGGEYAPTMVMFQTSAT